MAFLKTQHRCMEMVLSLSVSLTRRHSDGTGSGTVHCDDLAADGGGGGWFGNISQL